MKKKIPLIAVFIVAVVLTIAAIAGKILWTRYGYFDLNDYQKLANVPMLKNLQATPQSQADYFSRLTPNDMTQFDVSKKRKILTDFINFSSKLPPKDQVGLFTHANDVFPHEAVVLSNLCAFSNQDGTPKDVQYCIDATQTNEDLLNHPTIKALAYSNLGNYYFITNQFDKAKEVLQKAMDIDPKILQPKYMYAVIAQQEGNEKDCLKYYDQTWDAGFADANNSDYETYVKCLSAEVPERSDRLYDVVKKAVQVFPDQIEWHFNAGSMALKHNEIDLGYDELTKALLLLKADQPSKENEAMQGAIDQFLVEFFSVPKNQTQYEKLMNQGQKNMVGGNYAVAQEDMTQALEIRKTESSDVILTRFYLAVNTELSGQKDAALAAFRSLIQDAPYLTPAQIEIDRLSK